MNFKKKRKRKEKHLGLFVVCLTETGNSEFFGTPIYLLGCAFTLSPCFLLFYIFFFYPRLLSIAIQHFRAVPNGFARLLQEMRKASADNNYIVIECIIIVNVFKLYSKWIVRVNLSRRNRFIFNGIEGGKATCYVNRIKLKSLSCCKNNENLLCGYEEVFR